MSEKNTVQVLIGGKVIRLSGYESEEYLEKVASYLNHKYGDLAALPGWRRMAQDTKGMLLALNVADDCFKARAKAEELEDELSDRERELYDLKQQLVDLQVEMEKMKSSNGKNGGQRR